MSKPATDTLSQRSFGELLWRYCSFVWMFEEVPARADRFLHAAIMRANRSRGLRFLPCYMRRYLRWFIGSALLGSVSEAMAAPTIVSGTCFTFSSVAAVALLVAAIGYAAMRWRAFDHASY